MALKRLVRCSPDLRRGDRVRGRGPGAEGRARARAAARSGADLGGSSKYSGEMHEDRGGARFHVNSIWIWVNRRLRAPPNTARDGRRDRRPERAGGLTVLHAVGALVREQGATQSETPRRRPRRPEEEFPFLSNTSSDFACDSVGEKSRSVQEHRFRRCLGRRRGPLKSFGGYAPPRRTCNRIRSPR